MKDLHPTQKAILELDDLEKMTIRKITKKLKLSSTSVTHHHLRQLVKKGIIVKTFKGYKKPFSNVDIERDLILFYNAFISLNAKYYNLDDMYIVLGTYIIYLSNGKNIDKCIEFINSKRPDNLIMEINKLYERIHIAEKLIQKNRS